MNAFEKFREMQGDRWESTLLAHLDHGYVYSDPLNFVMARPVSTEWTRQEMTDPTDNSLSETSLTAKRDCWYVWAAIGDMWYLLDLLPYHMEWIAFQRREQDRVRFYNLQKLLRRHVKTSSTS